MKIRVKRAGWILFSGLAMAFFAVVVTAMFRVFYLKKDVVLPSFAAEGFSAKTKVTDARSATDDNLAMSAGADLKNGGFEEGFGAVPTLSNQTARISGHIPAGWFDLSQWSDLDAKYVDEHNNPHSGKSCLKIEIGDLRTRSILVAQPLKLTKDHRYQAGVWLRSDQPVQINAGIRMRGKPYFYYGPNGVIGGGKNINVGTQWQFVKFPALITDNRYPFVLLMVEFFSPHTALYVDDAELHDEGLATVPTAPKVVASTRISPLGH